MPSETDGPGNSVYFGSQAPSQKKVQEPKKTEHDVKIVKIVNVFKKIRTIAILMRKDVPNPGKLVW